MVRSNPDGRCASTHRAAISTRPKRTLSSVRCADSRRTPASTTMRRIGTRSNSGAPSRTMPGDQYAAIRRNASWWRSRRFIGARPGSTASGHSGIVSTTSGTPSPHCGCRHRSPGGDWRSRRRGRTAIWPPSPGSNETTIIATRSARSLHVS